MAFEVKKLENSKAEVVLTIEGTEFKNLRNKVIAKIAQGVEVPGFRKGKVPASVVEEKYADAIKEEISEEMLKANYEAVIKDGGIVPVDYFKLVEVKEEASKATATYIVEIVPEVKLGQYKGLEVEKAKAEVKSEDVESEMEKLLSQNSKLKEAAEGEKAQLEDTVSINFEGFVNGVAFEGGKAEGYDLKLGSKSFIDTFEEQIVGHVAGDEFEVNVKFPESYFKEELKGQPALFKVKVNSIKRVEKVELNDEFAKDMGFDTVAELRESKKAEIEKRENAKVEHGFINSILEKIKAASEVEIPESMIKREIVNRIREFEMQLKQQGANLDFYLKMNGISMEKLNEDLRPMAEEKIKIDLIIDEIAKVEKVEVKPEEIEEKMAEVASYYGMEMEKLKAELRKAGNYENFVENITIEQISKKTIDMIVSETVAK